MTEYKIVFLDVYLIFSVQVLRNFLFSALSAIRLKWNTRVTNWTELRSIVAQKEQTTGKTKIKK
jgi:hypothetical protein